MKALTRDQAAFRHWFAENRLDRKLERASEHGTCYILRQFFFCGGIE
jgi:hypothetical protein